MLTDLAADIQRMSPGGFAVVSIIVSVIVLVAFHVIWRNWSRARLIEDTPTARIRSAPQGYVELEGSAGLLPGPPIVAPLTGRHCVWYRYRIEYEEHTHDNRGHSRTHWRTVDAGTSEELFALEDATGRCVIDPDGAEVHPDDKDVWRGHHRWPSAGPPRRRSGLRIAAGDYRYTEERLLPGPMYAIGWFESVRSADGELKGATTALLRHWKQDQAGLLTRFDANGDGHIDAAEWARAREAAQQQTLRERAHKASEPAVNLLRRPASSQQPFILSAHPQDRLSRRYRRRALGGLMVTFLGVIVLAFLLIARVA
ncbi:MAG TPA: GIDE domain-containing protein [Thiohalobacter sp.]|nr:GIDE domain-containing protein [Thiohalobacter sp.]